MYMRTIAQTETDPEECELIEEFGDIEEINDLIVSYKIENGEDPKFVYLYDSITGDEIEIATDEYV